MPQEAQKPSDTALHVRYRVPRRNHTRWRAPPHNTRYSAHASATHCRKRINEKHTSRSATISTGPPALATLLVGGSGAGHGGRRLRRQGCGLSSAAEPAGDAALVGGSTNVHGGSAWRRRLSWSLAAAGTGALVGGGGGRESRRRPLRQQRGPQVGGAGTVLAVSAAATVGAGGGWWGRGRGSGSWRVRPTALAVTTKERGGPRMPCDVVFNS